MKKPPLLLSSILLSIIASLLIAIIAFAWTNPSGNPPSGGGALYYSGGNVGIGTTAPMAKLDVQASNTVGIRYIKSGTKDARIQVGDPTKTWGLAVGWATAGDFSIIEEGVAGDRLYIKQGGNVGIGTTTPNYKLTVAGEISAGGNAIKNVAAPVNGSDAATKAYVDAANVVHDYYQTTNAYDGSFAGSACVSGYHMCGPGEWFGRPLNTALSDVHLDWYSWFDTFTRTTLGGAPDCNRWTNNSIYYRGSAASVYVLGGNNSAWVFAESYCSEFLRVLCCN